MGPEASASSTLPSGGRGKSGGLRTIYYVGGSDSRLAACVGLAKVRQDPLPPARGYTPGPGGTVGHLGSDVDDDACADPADEDDAPRDMRTVCVDDEPASITPPGPPPSAPAPREDVQRVGGRYELREELGQGATARVWQAWDTLLQRMVALKVLDRQHANAAGLQRVLGEARATSDVVSDYVVRVQGVSGPDEEVPYIDMELCAEFTSKGQRALARPMSELRPRNLREALRWTIQAARGVHAAHQQGVFHRDLKPENILIRSASRRAQVTDFGLGVELSLLGEEARAASSTIAIRRQRRCIAGTPMYMAPEAARGLEPVDPSVPEQRQVLVALDIYGLGAVLYELLANRPPYVAKTGAETAIKDVLEQVRAGPPPKLRSWRIWLDRNSLRVPPRLARVVEKAMAREPADRYPSALALAEDLEAILSLRPTSLEVDQRLLRAGLSLRRNQAPLATLTAVVLTALVLVSGWMIGRGILDDAREALRDQREALRITAEARQQQQEAESARDAAVSARDDAVSARDQATRARDLVQADAGMRILLAEERAATAEAELARAVAREAAAQESEAAASRRARELEVALAARETTLRKAEESEARMAERLEAARAEAGQLTKQVARLTSAGDASARKVADLEKALAVERSRVADHEREQKRIAALLAAETKARRDAEGRATALLAEVERMRAGVAELVAAEAKGGETVKARARK